MPDGTGGKEVRTDMRDRFSVRRTLATLVLVILLPAALPGVQAQNAAPEAGLSVTPVDDLTFVDRTFSGSGSTDPDGKVVRYVFDFGDGSSPQDSSSDTAVHAYSTPGTYTATLRVYDDAGAESTTVSVDVVVRNRPPELADVPDRLVDEGGTIEFVVTASDPEGAPVTLSVTPLPSGASFSDAGDGTGTFFWAPDYNDAGQYDLVATASDGVATTTDPFVVFVRNKDRPPTIFPIDDVRTRESFKTTVAVRASDPEGDAIRLSISSTPQLPEASFFDRGDGTGTITWTPPSGSIGSYNVTVTARSKLLATQRSFWIHVEPALVALGPTTLDSHPDDALVLTARIHNPFAFEEELAFWATADADWTLVPPDSLVLQPGETRNVTLQVTPQPGVAVAKVRLHAVSSFAVTSTLTQEWTVRIPLALSVTPDQEVYRMSKEGIEGPLSGTVQVTWLDGRPATDIDILRVRQDASFVLPLVRSETVAVEEDPGTFRYTFRAGAHPSAYLTGPHDIVVSAVRGGATATAVFPAAYRVVV